MRPFTGEPCGYFGGLSAWAGLGMAQSRRYCTVDFGHVERAVEGIGGRAKVQRAFMLERKKPVCLPVTQGVVSISALVILCEHVLSLLPSNHLLWHGRCQNSPG